MTGSREINQTEYGESLSSAVIGGAEKTLNSMLVFLILTVLFYLIFIIVFPCKSCL